MYVLVHVMYKAAVLLYNYRVLGFTGLLTAWLLIKCLFDILARQSNAHIMDSGQLCTYTLFHTVLARFNFSTVTSTG